MTLEGIEQARRDAVRARARLDATLAATRARLHPNSLAGEAWDGVKAKGADLADEAVEAVKARPVAVSAGIGALALFLARGPLTRAAKRLISDRRDESNES
ncbi:MAG: DUF3618 domain-containing protein [Sphingomonas sp.]|nr:DUF3618 domain-containing protein [Sphingomonas sp.]